MIAQQYFLGFVVLASYGYYMFRLGRRRGANSIIHACIVTGIVESRQSMDAVFTAWLKKNVPDMYMERDEEE